MPHSAKDFRDLNDIRENAEKTAQEKSELLEANPILQAATDTDTDTDTENMQQTFNAIPAVRMITEQTEKLMGGSNSYLGEQMDNLGNLISLQRRMGEIWLETWCSLAMTPFTLLTDERKSA